MILLLTMPQVGVISDLVLSVLNTNVSNTRDAYPFISY
jgi:hypothetical protein